MCTLRAPRLGKPAQTLQLRCDDSDDSGRVASDRQTSTSRRLSHLEEENRSLRQRLAGGSSGPSGHNMLQTHQDATQHTEADASSTGQGQSSSGQSSSAATTPPSWSGDWLGGRERTQPYMGTQSPFLGLTSASVLEDTPGNFAQDQDNLAHFSTGPLPTDPGLLSQRLETEAAKQRASST